MNANIAANLAASQAATQLMNNNSQGPFDVTLGDLSEMTFTWVEKLILLIMWLGFMSFMIYILYATHLHNVEHSKRVSTHQVK